MGEVVVAPVGLAVAPFEVGPGAGGDEVVAAERGDRGLPGHTGNPGDAAGPVMTTSWKSSIEDAPGLRDLVQPGFELRLPLDALQRGVVDREQAEELLPAAAEPAGLADPRPCQ
ncbi:hypothetical protein [Amycolatopsis sp. H20-H5]|uniref:hypothetical protein n=1 Tax=Amycolatopsis sp. H20-H5 TaxID=3046309 RepID=UPI002DBA82E7|nr:hypothetical protein [Amycolatopsis sp. H20-H5]MEC3974760.1 hypothetical protein [Amycolatopsis sp. H20-H5]